MESRYFKQMPIYSGKFNSERIEIFSYDRIANIVIDTIVTQLVTDHGWDYEAAVVFVKSKAIRCGLDQTLGELLENAATQWVKEQEKHHKSECHVLAKVNSQGE